MVELEVFSWVGHLSYCAVMGNATEISGREIESPSRCELQHHICVDVGFADNVARQRRGETAVISSPANCEENIRRLAELLQRRLSLGEFLKLAAEECLVP